VVAIGVTTCSVGYTDTVDRTPKYSRCRLCGGQAPLRESHIFPKFYWEWLRETGDQYFRDPRRPNLRLQDGFKLEMLCSDCEGRFSRVETPFARSVFRPLTADPAAIVPYEGFAIRLLISVHWRNLALDLDSHSPRRTGVRNWPPSRPSGGTGCSTVVSLRDLGGCTCSLPTLSCRAALSTIST
jgi:hypothetical protein